METVEDGLKICYGVANDLKEKFPNDIMKITDNTIIEYSVKNSRLLGGKNGMNSMRNRIAYYTYYKPHRIVIKQKFLKERRGWITKYNNNKRTPIFDNFAIVELMCHELAHHRTSGHAKGFKVKYKRFLDHMVNEMISGKYY